MSSKLCTREDLAGRIIRRVENDGLCVGMKRGAQLLLVKSSTRRSASRRTQFHKDWLCAAQHGIRAVVLVKRLENDDFIALIADSKQCGDHRFGRPATDSNVFFRIDFDPLPLLHLPRDRVSQALGAPCDRVLVHIRSDGFLRGVLDFGWGGEVGESLRKIDGAILHGLARHFSDDGLGEVFDLIAEKMLLKGGVRHAGQSSRRIYDCQFRVRISGL